MGDMNNSVFRPFAIVVLVAMLLPSCGWFKKKKPPVAKPDTRLAGRIQSVNKESKFVLIRRYGRWNVDEGETVESRGGDRTANLKPTGEKLGEHIAADIRSGDAEVGDAVYIRRTTKKKKPSLLTPPPTSTPTTPATVVPAPDLPQNTPESGVSIPKNPPATPELPKNLSKSQKKSEEPEDQL